MPNMPDVNNVLVAVQLPRELRKKVKKDAEAHKMDFSQYVRWVLNEATADVSLTYEEILEIAEEVKNASEKRQEKQRSK